MSQTDFGRSPGQASRFPCIALMGPPGCGKTTVGKILATSMNLPHIDLDDDVLETNWGCAVGHRLAEVGDEAFLEQEAAEVCKLRDVKGVLSLSGSVPLVWKAMEHVSTFALVVYLNVPTSTILARLEAMKVDRIVGCGTLGLAAVLQQRNKTYERSYDIRIPAQANDSPQVIAERVKQAVAAQGWHYHSTRGHGPALFPHLLFTGLAPDGGLFLPDSVIPFFGEFEFQEYKTLPFPEICRRVLEKLPTLLPSQLKDKVAEAYSSFTHPAVLPLTALPNNKLYLLETFHGPTASFKDLSLQLLPLLMNAANPGEARRLALLVATSGDTGSAALFGFARQHTPVVVLFPAQGVSSVQRLQMTAACPSALVIGVEADFDWCQNFVKQLLAEQAASFAVDQWLLSSANSINFGRLAPQIAYSVQAHAQLLSQGRLQPGQKFDITFPTGNFGNIFGALFARRMGLPISKIICASNDNNVLFDFLRTGVYDLTNRPFLTTASPSIDILISSNLERWLYLLYQESHPKPEAAAAVAALMQSLKEKQRFEVSGKVLEAIRAQIECGWCSQQQCLETIGRVFREERVVIDPHTAVACAVAGQFTKAHRPMVVVSTAHWGKFPAAVIEAVGQASPTPARLAEHNSLPLDEQLRRLQSLLGDLYVLPPSLDTLLNAAVPIHKTVLPPDAEILTNRIRQYLAEFS